MLSNKELVMALIINLEEWDWDINSKYSIDEKTAMALVKEFRNGRTDDTGGIHEQSARFEP